MGNISEWSDRFLKVRLVVAFCGGPIGAVN